MIVLDSEQRDEWDECIDFIMIVVCCSFYFFFIFLFVSVHTKSSRKNSLIFNVKGEFWKQIVTSW